jgi:sortase A
MDYEGVRYTYRVTSTREVDPSNVKALVDIVKENPGKPMITLITCTPLGSSKYRLLVAGEQIYPDYGGAKVADDGTEADTGSELDDDASASSMPSNHGTPLEQFWNWLIGND